MWCGSVRMVRFRCCCIGAYDVYCISNENTVYDGRWKTYGAFTEERIKGNDKVIWMRM